MGKDLDVIRALWTIADSRGVVCDSFKVNAALRDAGLDPEDLDHAFWTSKAIGTAPSPAGTFGHLHYQLPLGHRGQHPLFPKPGGALQLELV